MMRADSVRAVADLEELARETAELVLASARESIAARGVFHLALSGGSTPRRAYAELARRGDEALFERWHAWFGDERCVPPEDEHSNYRMAAESGLLARIPGPHVHRMRGEAREPEREAERYERELCDTVGRPPRLDLVLLGLGTDGHTASLFPGTPALAARGWVTVGRAPEPPHARLTLTFSTLAEARSVVFQVAGADKARALSMALGTSDGEVVPARRVRPTAGSLLWLVERSAADPLHLGSSAPPGG